MTLRPEDIGAGEQPNDAGPGGESRVRQALESSRVDLIELRRLGLPEREFVPGAHGWLAKSKRHHLSAERKSGKSLAIGVIAALDIIAAGGVVVVLDRENGADEYARRLDAVLRARGADAAFEERVRERFRYHAWPLFKIEWGKDPAYPDAFSGADLVIFDSSRKHLTGVGLKEDSSDDYSAFTEALVDPLARAGNATVILDNTGHEETRRARGTSAKADLADVVFTMRKAADFSVVRAGRVELTCEHSRFGEVEGSWEMGLGGGHYGSWSRVGHKPPEAREDLLRLTLAVLVEAGGPLGVGKIAKAIRALDHAPKFANDTLEEALPAWAEDPASGIVSAGAKGGYRLTPGPQLHAQPSIPEPLRDGPIPRDGRDGSGWPPSGMAETPHSIGDSPIPETARDGSGCPHPASAPPYGGGMGRDDRRDGALNGTADALRERLLAYIADHEPTLKQLGDAFAGEDPQAVLGALKKLDCNNRIRQYGDGWRVVR